MQKEVFIRIVPLRRKLSHRENIFQKAFASLSLPSHGLIKKIQKKLKKSLKLPHQRLATG